MTTTAAQFVILATGLYLVGLAIFAWLSPSRARHFLMQFAASAAVHYLELLIRLLIGWAFLVRGPSMPFASPLVAFGWVLIVTTAGLCFVPWTRHRQFTLKAVPQAVRFLPGFAAASFLLGSGILAAALRSS